MSPASASAPEPGWRTARFSRLGNYGAIWFALGGTMSVLGAPDRRVVWRAATGRVAAAYAVNTTLKLVVRRRRPPGGLVSTPTQLSFPSAHAATSFAGARAYSWAGGPSSALYALAGLLALSRLRLGVHHPSDVLAGALLGLLVAGSGPVAPGRSTGQVPWPPAPGRFTGQVRWPPAPGRFTGQVPGR